MKKLSLLFAAIAVVVSFTLRAATEVSTAEELAAAITGAATDDIKLTADIDCSSWTSLDFSGTLDGANHAVSGLTVPLFVNLAGTVENLIINGAVGGVNTQVPIPDFTDFGFLALTTTAAHVESVNVKGYSLVVSHTQGKGVPVNHIGFLVACATDGSVFISDMTMEGCTASLGGHLGFGGIVGCVRRSAEFQGTCAATFSGCVNNVEFAVTGGCQSAGSGGLGGILGREGIGNDAKRPCEVVFENCINNGSVTVSGASGNTAFGGLLGQASVDASSAGGNAIRMTGCTNHGGFTVPSGKSCNNMRLGGFIGMCGRYGNSVYFDKCLNDGDFALIPSGVSGNTHGGFIGYIYDIAKNAKISVLNSTTRGNITIPVTAGKTGQIGGVCGSMTMNASYAGVAISVKNSSFIGTLTASSIALLVAQCGTATSINSGTTFTVDNCWFAEEGTLVDTADAFGERYSVTNAQFHTPDADEAENAALALVAAGNDDYVTWLVSDKSGHPEPVLGAAMYTVIFKDWDEAILSLQQVEEGSAATAPDDPARTGYSFTGWEPSDFSEVTSNMTIVATYEQSANFRTATFIDWDGIELAQVTVEAGTAVGDKAPQPTRTGYTLIGWTLGGEPYDLSMAVTDDITLNAFYQINVYDVVFFDWEDNQLGETQKVAYLNAATAPSLPMLPEGKVFWKWSDGFGSITENLEVRAMICDAEQTITSPEDFAAKINAQTPSVVRFTLDADIVLENWTSVDFSASIDGQGHGISGLTQPLFNEVSGATIENLVISNSTLDAKTSAEVVGMIARKAGDGTMIGNIETASDCLVKVGNNVVAGGIVGVLQNSADYVGDVCSWIVGCTNRAALTKTSTDTNSNGSFAGIVGRIDAQGLKDQPFVTNGIRRCANYGSITCNYNGGRLGGLVGKVATSNDKALVAILGSANYADIIGATESGSDAYKKLYVGGIVASTVSTCYDVLIDGCVNYGNVSSDFEPEGQTENLDKTAAGIIAHIDLLAKSAVFTIRNSANYGNVEGENASGIIGYLGANMNFAYTKNYMVNCAGYGTVSGRAHAALAVGNWIKPNTGFARAISNCFYVVDSVQPLPVVGGGEEGYDLSGVLTSADDGFSCDSARAALSDWAEANGYEKWVLGKVGDVVYPELAIFCANPLSTPKGLMLLLR